MKANIFIIAFLCSLFFSCTSKIYSSNGETIYKTGRNLNGEKLLDKKSSRIKIIGNCKTCHGANGDAMRGISIRFGALSDPAKNNTPYTDQLFYRFLDEDLKSNGNKANIGVIWKMKDQDKKDLLDYLKKL